MTKNKRLSAQILLFHFVGILATDYFKDIFFHAASERRPALQGHHIPNIFDIKEFLVWYIGG